MFKGTGIRPAELLIPASSDISKWSVVACDQYTSEPAYWQGVREFVGGAPSTLNLILPEAELVLDKTQPYGISSETLEKTLAIRGAMSACLDGGVFGEPVRGFILTERRFDSSEKPPRIGLVATIDLEEYAYDKDGGSPVRPTEGTVVERLPPRVVVRRRAPLETSHALLLIEDEQKSVIEPIYGKREDLRVVYDTKLYKGGSITGWAVEEPSDIKLIADALANMNPRSGIRAAVGDGNHSLAAAKQSWESVKADLSEDEIETHLARFAMVEVCNIFDDGITFEPIHRIVMGVAASSMMIAFFAWLKEQGAKPAVVIGDKVDSKSVSADLQTIGLIGVSGAYTIVVENPPRLLAVDTLQTFLDEWGQSGAKVDYIHGGDTLRRLAAEPNRAGFILPPVDKAGLFSSVAKYGALPRKTFSMGEASEKRYYLECRKITSYTP